jgi:hypothetical protein
VVHRRSIHAADEVYFDAAKEALVILAWCGTEGEMGNVNSPSIKPLPGLVILLVLTPTFPRRAKAKLLKITSASTKPECTGPYVAESMDQQKWSG